MKTPSLKIGCVNISLHVTLRGSPKAVKLLRVFSTRVQTVHIVLLIFIHMNVQQKLTFALTEGTKACGGGLERGSSY